MIKKNVIVKNKFKIKIPKNVTIIFCNKTNLIIFKGFLATKVLKPKVKIFQLKNFILISKIPTDSKISTNFLKNSNKFQGTVLAQIKAIFIEISNVLFKKLIFVGVGYRAFIHENSKNDQMTLKLGFSHLIYKKIPEELQSICLKRTKLFIFGVTSLKTLTQAVASVRQCKPPEPYKGKGILHYQEKILIKKGKKV